MGEWQTIETAPTDDTDVLVWTSHEQMLIASCYGTLWSNHEFYLDDYMGGIPTHWQPLPTPPTGDALAKAGG